MANLAFYKKKYHLEDSKAESFEQLYKELFNKWTTNPNSIYFYNWFLKETKPLRSKVKEESKLFNKVVNYY